MATLSDLPVGVHRLIALHVDDERPWRKDFHIINLLKVNRYWEDVVKYPPLTQGRIHKLKQ